MSKIFARVPNTSQLSWVQAESPLDALSFVCGLSHGAVKHTTVFNSVWQAARTLCTRSGDGLRFIVSTVSCTTDATSVAANCDDVDCYPMNACVAECGQFCSDTVLTPARAADLRLLGHSDCKSFAANRVRTAIRVSLMQTPRRRVAKEPVVAVVKQSGWCSAWCAAKRDAPSVSVFSNKDSDNDKDDAE